MVKAPDSPPAVDNVELVVDAPVSRKAELEAPLPEHAREHEELQYINLIRDVLARGESRADRTGTGTCACRM